MGFKDLSLKFALGLGGTMALVGYADAQSGSKTSYQDAPSQVYYQTPSAAATSDGNAVYDYGNADYGDVYSPAASSSCGCNSGGCSASRTPIIGSRLCGGCDGGSLGDPWTLFNRGCDDPVVTLGGWVQTGYHSQSNDLFNNRPDQFNLHQAWFFAEKAAVSENGELGFGFRFDGMYGIDSGDTQSFGNTVDAAGNLRGFDNGDNFVRGADYGWAIPQVYVEMAKGDWSVKVGHFYTLIGYEVVTAPDNFFYSHAMTMYNSEPFTHTGAIATYNMSDDTTLYGGYTLGWDTGFDQFESGGNFLGGFSTPLTENTQMTYINTIGDFGARGDDAYSHSFVFDTAVTDNLNYVLQSDMVRVDETGEDNIGINQYLLYSVCDRLALGTRVEWWKADEITGYAPHGGTFHRYERCPLVLRSDVWR